MTTNPTAGPELKKPISTTRWLILVIITVAVIAFALCAYWNKNRHSNTNANQNTNMAVISNVNSAGNQNANTLSNQNANSAVVNVNDNIAANSNGSIKINTTANTFTTFTSPVFGLQLNYPAAFRQSETVLTQNARSSRTDGLLADFGFRPAELQGPLFLVRVFSMKINQVVTATKDYGVLTDESITIANKTATKFSEGSQRYGIDGTNYSYIVEIGNYRNNDDLTAYDRMLNSLKID